jgi:hypothetical protein
MKPITYKFLLFAYLITIGSWFLLVHDYTALRNRFPKWWEIVDFVTFLALGIFLLVASIKFTVEKRKLKNRKDKTNNEDV